MNSVTECFLSYVKHHTASVESSPSVPSAKCQLNFAAFLAEECKHIGLSNIFVDEYGYVTASLKGSVDNSPIIGFIAHMDTSPDASGENIQPSIIKNYDGSDIPLKKGILSSNEFPAQKEYIGQTLIITDGTTLLGADDKAGIAEILTEHRGKSLCWIKESMTLTML